MGEALPFVLLGLEGLVLIAALFVARRGDYRVRRRRLRCPLCHATASLYVGEYRDPSKAPVLIRCSLVERGVARSCHGDCLARTPNEHAALARHRDLAAKGRRDRTKRSSQPTVLGMDSV
jgi:hypothetical protein